MSEQQTIEQQSNLVYRVWRIREGREADRAAKRLFLFSILYLFALFAVLLGEHIARALT